MQGKDFGLPQQKAVPPGSAAVKVLFGLVRIATIAAWAVAALFALLALIAR